MNINAATGAAIIKGPRKIDPPVGSDELYACPFFAISASPALNANNSAGGNVKVLGQGLSGGVSIAVAACAIEAGKSESFDSIGNSIGGSGNEGGYINLQAQYINFVFEGGPVLKADGDHTPIGGLGKGGALRLSSELVTVVAMNGIGDVRPLGYNDTSIDGLGCIFANFPIPSDLQMHP